MRACVLMGSPREAGNTAALLSVFLEEWEELPPVFRTSSVKRSGREEILGFIGECLRRTEEP